MDTQTVTLPQPLMREADAFVTSGMFASSQDVVIAALAEFVRHYRPELAERFATEDIEWAKGLKDHAKNAHS